MHTSPCLVFKEVYCSRLRSAHRFIICRHSFVSKNQWKEKFFFGNVRQGKHSFGQKFKKLTLSIKCTFEKYWLQKSKSTSGELDQWTRWTNGPEDQPGPTRWTRGEGGPVDHVIQGPSWLCHMLACARAKSPGRYYTIRSVTLPHQPVILSATPPTKYDLLNIFCMANLT